MLPKWGRPHETLINRAVSSGQFLLSSRPSSSQPQISARSNMYTIIQTVRVEKLGSRGEQWIMGDNDWPEREGRAHVR